MKYEDISGISVSELNKKKLELRKGMFEARMKNSLGQLTNPLSIRKMRRDIARLNTALNSRGAGSEAKVVAKKTKAKG